MGRRPLRKTQEIEVSTEEIADGVIVRPVGVIDLRHAPSLQAGIAEAQRNSPARLIIDLSGVTEMDSAVVAILVEAMQVARRGAGILVLCGLQDRVRSLFEITRLDDSVFTIVETTDEAIALPNRRKFKRFAPACPDCDLGTVLDISAGGARLRSTTKLKGTVRLRLRTDQAELDLEADVVWTRRVARRQHEAGLRFVNLDTPSAKTLALMVGAAREEAASLRPRRGSGDDDQTTKAA